MSKFFPVTSQSHFNTEAITTKRQQMIKENNMTVILDPRRDCKSLPNVVVLTETQNSDDIRMWANAFYPGCIMFLEKPPVAGLIFIQYYAISTTFQGNASEVLKLTSWLSLVASYSLGVKTEDTGNVFGGTGASGGSRTIGIPFKRERLIQLVEIYYQIQSQPEQSEELLMELALDYKF